MKMFDHTFGFLKNRKRILFYRTPVAPNQFAVHFNLNRHLYYIKMNSTLQETFCLKPEIENWFEENNIPYEKYEIVYRYFVVRQNQDYSIKIMGYFDSILQLENANDLMRFKLAWAE